MTEKEIKEVELFMENLFGVKWTNLADRVVYDPAFKHLTLDQKIYFILSIFEHYPR